MAEAKKCPVTQDGLFQIKYVCDATLSPDGAVAVYTLSETKGKGDKESDRQSLFMVSTSGGRSRRLSGGSGSSFSPRFSPDGKTLYFLSTRDKVAQVYALPWEGGEAEAVTSLEQGVTAFKLTADETLVFAAPTRPPQSPTVDDHPRIDRFWFRFDPVPGYLQDMNQTIFVAKPGGKPRALTDGVGMISSFDVSPDGTQVAYLVSGLKEHGFVQSNLMVAPIRGDGKPRMIVGNKVLMSVDWDASGGSLVSIAQLDGLGQMPALVTVDVATGKVNNRTKPLDLMPGAALQLHIPARIQSRVIPDGDRHVYACITRGGEVHPNRVSLAGKPSAAPIGEGQEVNHLMARHRDSLLVINQSTSQPPELYLLDAASGAMKQLTTHNDHWRDRHIWPMVERLVVKVKRGVEIEGWVMRPRQSRPPFKTILNIHGGPHGGYGCGFWADMHELVGAGYAVAFMNPRGSTGYGSDFMRSILGVWGYPELEDFNAFLDELVDRGIAHPERLGVTGISGGGHLSSWLIGHTNRFKAAVPEQGVYNMVSMWGVSDAGQALIDLEMQTTLHKDPMKFWKHSPMAYANRCRTPTLLLQGEDDVRCPVSQAEEYFSALKHFGCEVELVRMKKCNHGAQIGGRPALRRFRMNVLKDWFDRHIR